MPEAYSKPQNICDLAKRLAALGYYPVPIPAGCKGPTIAGWDKLRLTPEDCETYFPEKGALVGVLHVNLLALDIDVYDARLSETITAEALKRFPGALERVGQSPKSALFFRMDEPGFKVGNTEKHEKDGLSAQVEVRSVSRQIVAYGVHPETGRPYTWPRGELWATPRDSLPVAKREDIEKFRDWCNDQIKKWAGVTAPNIIDLGLHQRGQIADERPTSDAFREALSYVPPSAQYDDWLSTLMAIHDFYNGSTEGLSVAQDWSSPYPDYTPQEVAQKWRSFEVGKGTSYRTVFYLAKLNGADLSEMAKKHKREPELRNEAKADIGGQEAHSERPIRATSVTRDQLRKLPPRKWLYGNKLIRGFCTICLSPGGIGKSAWTAAVAVDLAKGAMSLHDQPHAKLRSWIYNLEDPRDETLRKLSALDRAKGLSDDDLDRIKVDSGRDRSLIVAHEIDRGIYMAAPDVDAVIEEMRRERVDLLIVDPAVRSHRLPENDNKAIDVMMDQFARIAHEADAAVLLVHHSRKGFVAGEMDSARGASSLMSAARVAITLQTMQQEEAVDMNIPELERGFYVRVDNAKRNLSPPSHDAEWLKLESVNINNASEEYPDGDNVQVVTKWEPPSPFADLAQMRLEIFDRIERGFVHEDGTREPWGENKQSKEKWVGYAILASFPNGQKTEKQAAAIVKSWIADGFLLVKKYKNAKGNDRSGVFVADGSAQDD